MYVFSIVDVSLLLAYRPFIRIVFTDGSKGCSLGYLSIFFYLLDLLILNRFESNVILLFYDLIRIVLFAMAMCLYYLEHH